jgi:hypothetical protein
MGLKPRVVLPFRFPIDYSHSCLAFPYKASVQLCRIIRPVRYVLILVMYAHTLISMGLAHRLHMQDELPYGMCRIPNTANHLRHGSTPPMASLPMGFTGPGRSKATPDFVDVDSIWPGDMSGADCSRPWDCITSLHICSFLLPSVLAP